MLTGKSTLVSPPTIYIFISSHHPLRQLLKSDSTLRIRKSIDSPSLALLTGDGIPYIAPRTRASQIIKIAIAITRTRTGGTGS